MSRCRILSRNCNKEDHVGMWLVMGIVLVVALNELPHGDLVH